MLMLTKVAKGAQKPPVARSQNICQSAHTALDMAVDMTVDKAGDMAKS